MKTENGCDSGESLLSAYEDLFDDRRTKDTRAFLPEFHRVRQRKPLYLHDAAALDLADALGTSLKLWMNLQATFDLDKAMKARQAA